MGCNMGLTCEEKTTKKFEYRETGAWSGAGRKIGGDTLCWRTYIVGTARNAPRAGGAWCGSPHVRFWEPHREKKLGAAHLGEHKHFGRLFRAFGGGENIYFLCLPQASCFWGGLFCAFRRRRKLLGGDFFFSFSVPRLRLVVPPILRPGWEVVSVAFELPGTKHGIVRDGRCTILQIILLRASHYHCIYVLVYHSTLAANTISV